jgi:hypothetical protein
MNPKRLTILDAVLLLAATAIACASMRFTATHLWGVLRTVERERLNWKDKGYYLETVFFETPSTRRMDTTLGFVSYYTEVAIAGDDWAGFTIVDDRGQAAVIAEDLYAISFALLLLWSLALFVRQLAVLPLHPNFARQPGSWACGSAVIATLVVLWLEYLTRFHLSPVLISGAVLISWLSLAVSRRWSPEPTAIDRAGRVVGIGWLVLFPLYFAWRFVCVGGSRSWMILLLNQIL